MRSTRAGRLMVVMPSTSWRQSSSCIRFPISSALSQPRHCSVPASLDFARHWGMRVAVSTREEKHRKLAAELGAEWVGGAYDDPPMPLNAAIVFAPAGELVPAALKNLKRGGALVLGGIYMSPIPSFPYDLLYWERKIRSVANNTRQDGFDFL